MEALRQLLAEFQVRVDPEGNLKRGQADVDALKAKFEGLQDTLGKSGPLLRDASGRFLPRGSVYNPTPVRAPDGGGGGLTGYFNRAALAARGFGASLREALIGGPGGGLQGALASVQSGLGALATGFAVHRFVALVDEIGGIGEQAAKLGVTNAEFQRLDVLAKQNATSVQALGTVFRTLANAAVQPTKETTAAFAALGVQVKADDGTFKSRQDLFFETAGALADVSDSTKRAALAQDVFGRGAIEILPLLANGRNGIEEQRAALMKLKVVSDDTVDGADKLSDRWQAMTFKLKVLFSEALKPLLGVLGWVTDKFDELTDQIDGTNVGISALTVAAAALMPTLMSVARAAAPWAALYLVVDDLVTTLRGGDTYTRDFIEALFGEGATEKAIKSIAEVKAALVDLFNFVFNQRGGKLFGKLMGVDQDEIEARRQERQSAADNGAPVEAPNATLKWLADTLGITDDVMAKRREYGLDPETGRELPAPRFNTYGPPTAEGSVAGNVTIGDTNVSISMGTGDPKAVGDEMTRVLERNRQTILQDVQ